MLKAIGFYYKSAVFSRLEFYLEVLWPLKEASVASQYCHQNYEPSPPKAMPFSMPILMQIYH